MLSDCMCGWPAVEAAVPGVGMVAWAGARVNLSQARMPTVLLRESWGAAPGLWMSCIVLERV